MTIESERLWILILAGVSFLGGGAAGLLAGSRVHPRTVEAGPFASYESLLSATFDLDPGKRRELRWVLGQYQRDLEDLKARHLSELEPELVRIGEICRDRIVNNILDAEQQQVFQNMASGSLDPTRSLALQTPPTH